MTTITTVSTSWPAVLRFSSGANTVTDMLVGTTSIGWKMETQTVYDEDSGVESLRVKHTYFGPLLPTQDIRFELVFMSASDPFIDRKIMEADSAVCQMTRSTTNTMFWNMVATDNYYKCDTSETCGASAAAVLNPLPNKI